MSRNDEQDVAERIRVRAYHLWEQEGRPEGRREVHWDQATELVAIEDNHGVATRPVSAAGPMGEPVEPIEAVENVGEFPTLTDQGEEQTFPARQSAAKAAKSASKTFGAAQKKPAAKAALNGIHGAAGKRTKEARTNR